MNIEEIPKPRIKTGWVLIPVKAFGLNRSELFTRRGDSPGVVFPRIQGIEFIGANRYSVYMGESKNLPKELLQEFIDRVENSSIKLNIDKVFLFDKIAEEHQYMEDNRSMAKIVVRI